MPLVATSRIDGRIRSGQFVLAAGEATFIAASWTSAPAHARVGCGLVVGPSEREIIEDRAVRTIVAVAGAHEFSKRVCHRLHLSDARLEIADMCFGDPLHFAARAA